MINKVASPNISLHSVLEGSHMSFSPLSDAENRKVFIAPHHLIKIPRSNQGAEDIPWRCLIYMTPQTMLIFHPWLTIHNKMHAESKVKKHFLGHVHQCISCAFLFTNETSTNSC